MDASRPVMDTIDIALKFLERFKVVSLEYKNCDVEAEIHADFSICVRHHARARDSIQTQNGDAHSAIAKGSVPCVWGV